MKKLLAAADAAMKRIPGDGKKTLIGAVLTLALHLLPAPFAALIPFEALVELLAQLLLAGGLAHKGVKLGRAVIEARESD